MEVYNNFVLVEQVKVEERKTESGIVIYSEFFERPEFTKKDVKLAVVKEVGEDCKFYQPGDTVILKSSDGSFIDVNGKEHLLLFERQILVKQNEDKSLSLPPHNILVKIKKADREALFSKWIEREDGTKVQLFIDVEPDKIEDRAATKFVSMGEVIAVGSAVPQAQPGDTAILEYLVDNDEQVIVGYDGQDKLVVLDAVTTYHGEDQVVYQNRNMRRDQVVAFRGDIDNQSPILGYIRENKLFACDPFIFLNHEKNVYSKITNAGLLIQEVQKVIIREVLSVSPLSARKYGIKNGAAVLVSEQDTFDIQLEGKKITAINDVDVHAGVITTTTNDNHQTTSSSRTTEHSFREGRDVEKTL